MVWRAQAERRATRIQEGAEKSSGQKGDERPRGREHSERHRVPRRALSGHMGVEWPGSQTDRRASSSWLGTDFPESLLRLRIILLTLARFPYCATFPSGGEGVGATPPPGVWKLSVVELSGKTSGLLSTSTRDW